MEAACCYNEGVCSYTISLLMISRDTSLYECSFLTDEVIKGIHHKLLFNKFMNALKTSP